MKKHLLTKIMAIILSVMMIFSFTACTENPPSTSEYPKNGEKKIISVEKDFFYNSTTSSQTVSVAYYENQPEILLVEINYAVNSFINEFFLGETEGAYINVEETDSAIKLTRENNEYCEIDFVKDTIYFSDFDAFNSKPFRANPHDLISSPYQNEQGENIFIQRERSFYTPGYSIMIDLAERNIPLDIYQGKKYIPFQTFNDLFVSPQGANFAYNGENIFLLIGSALLPEIEEIYYHEQKTQKSDALAQFNYNELCLYLDLYYGMQDEHGFYSGFDYYLDRIGLKEKFLSNDALDAFNALGSLTMGYIGDGHSSLVGASPYLGAKKPSEGVDINLSQGLLAQIYNSQMYQQARAEALGEFDFYQEVGNTAYVTFDEFTLGDRSGGYEDASEIVDTLTIIMVAHARIAQNEQIENVVVDLSCNGGGAVDSAIYLVSWMLGNCDFSIYNGVTQSKAITTYSADVNLDGVFDENDNISDKNLYCIISPVSFSCGNYAPAMLKASGKVTIVGKTSSGGGCIVRSAVTADGSIFSVSDSSQMSIVKNGTYYSVDQGVTPDIALTKIESFYNREALTDYLNKLK